MALNICKSKVHIGLLYKKEHWHHERELAPSESFAPAATTI